MEGTDRGVRQAVCPCRQEPLGISDRAFFGGGGAILIDGYIQLDQPLDCAGSIKVERAGVSLLRDTRGRDINSLYGLPLMLLSEALQSFSYSIYDFIKEP